VVVEVEAARFPAAPQALLLQAVLQRQPRRVNVVGPVQALEPPPPSISPVTGFQS
jgi:hypothetical protein